MMIMMVVVVFDRFTGIAVAGGKEVATSLNDMIYLVGNVGTSGIGAFDLGSKNVLGRIKLSSLLELELDQLSSLVGREKSGGDWSRHSDTEQRVGLFSPASPELTLQYHSGLRRWYSLQVDSVTAQLILWTAEQPWGEWQSTVIHNIPAPYDDINRYRCYAGKGHPEMGREREGNMVELVFTYVCNTSKDGKLLFQEDQLDVYTPRFVRVTLHKPAANTAGVLEESRA